MLRNSPEGGEKKQTAGKLKRTTYVFFSEGYPVIFSKPQHLRNLPAVHSYQGLLKMMTTNSVLVMLKTGHGRDHWKYPGAVAFQKKTKKNRHVVMCFFLERPSFGAGSIILNCHLAKPLLRCFFWWYPAKPRCRNLLYPPCTRHTIDDTFNRERERAVTHRKNWDLREATPGFLTKHVFGKGDGCVDNLVTFVKAFRRRRRRVEEVPDAHAKSIRRRGCGSLWTEESNPKKLAISQCPADEPAVSFRECIWNVHHFGAGSIILNCHLAKPLLRCFFLMVSC